MKPNIKLLKVNFFGESTGTDDFNAKVLYSKNNKTYLAHIYIDFFFRKVYEGKNNPKEHKCLSGLIYTLNDFGIKNDFKFDLIK